MKHATFSPAAATLSITAGVAAALSTLLATTAAHACGGFFCSATPIDQSAERILFEIGADSVTMTTQISFRGNAEDFAWVLPLSSLPDPDSLGVLPQAALNALDVATGPVFAYPAESECAGRGVDVPDSDEAGSGSVDVLLRREVGNYDVAVVRSDDPTALVTWLNTEGYRVTSAMEPYIDLYLNEGLDFLALKLSAGADVSDIQPFRFTLPGGTPSIPLRMTALAAEPEMSVLAFVLAEQRYEGKNWASLTIPSESIRFSPLQLGGTSRTNWASRVAEAVDEAGGQGWVTEFAGPSASYAQQVRQQLDNGGFSSDEQRQAAEQLLGLLEQHPYLTRLYTRLSAEEMSSDPVFGRAPPGDVDRLRQLARVVDGIDQCSEDYIESYDACDFATCGAAGLCRHVDAGPFAGLSGFGCACIPGATARATTAPDGTPSVTCQDQRMSFLNAGDIDTGSGEVLPDACAGFSCGEHGECVAMNLTPTCACDPGFVAMQVADLAGTYQVSCVSPLEEVPGGFYDRRLAALPAELPGGRELTGLAATPPGAGADDPLPDGSGVAAASAEGGSCAFAAGSVGDGARSKQAGLGALLGMLLAGSWVARRKARSFGLRS